MKRDMEWKERLEDGVRRVVRVKFQGQGKIKWQFKRSDEEEWDYDSQPLPGDWDMLEQKVDQLYHRRRAAFRDLELVQRLKKENT